MDRQPILALFLVLATSATALSQPTYPLRYRLQAGEQVVTRVVHEAETQTSIGGVSEDTSASTSSIKVWEVQSVDDQGNMTFVYQIDGVRLRQQLSDSCESYDSQSDHEVPARFRNVADCIAKPLATITIAPDGSLVARDREFRCPVLGIGELTVPLPIEPVAVGAQWHVPREIRVKLRDNSYKTIKVRENYRLEKVSAGVATIRVATEPLTPVSDPAVEAQLVQQLSKGTIKFDIDSGRVISKRLDWSERVLGFSGPASSMRYDALWTEELLPASARLAKVAGGPS